MLKMGWIISPYTVKQAAFDLQQKETGSKTVALATSKYASCGAFLSVQRACQVPIVLHHYLQRYSLLCVLTSILSHLMTSSVPDLHNTKILWISLERDEIWQKGKHHSSSLFKAFQIHLFFNTSIFRFIGTLSPRGGGGNPRHMWGIWTLLPSPPSGIWPRTWVQGWGHLLFSVEE